MTTEFPLPPSLELITQLSQPQLCGQLLVVGFDGTRLPDRIAEYLRAGLRGGIILFKRNLPDIETAWRLCREIIEAYPPGVAPFIAVDQEGGRVCRLPAPFVTLPPMRVFGSIGDAQLTYRAGAEVGRQLSAVGFTCNFAPVLDVDTNPQNPIIGDRSFSCDPRVVAEQAMAFAQGLENQGVLACGKHFPGHGDTSLDSHLDLPTVEHDAARLSNVELFPFREAVERGLSALMTAHVCYPALDPSGAPATLSHKILTGLLRESFGFGQVLFSDDLEMRGILKGQSLSAAACGAIQSGVDALLICHNDAQADEALTALVSLAETDPLVSHRIVEANVRFHRLRQRFAPRPEPTLESLRYCLSAERASELIDEVDRRLAASSAPIDTPVDSAS